MTGPGLIAVSALLAIPVAAALFLGLSPVRHSVWLNALASLLTLFAAIALLAVRPTSNPYLLVDDLNAYFAGLTALVAFTTSVFSASYLGHEVEIGRLRPVYVRLYHAMYQLCAFAMLLALLANNIGLMWVAIELATLAAVLMVGIYRTHAALQAAWKYFILGSVGIGLALFGTILVYLAAQPAMGQGLEAMAWSALVVHADAMEPALLNLAFVFLLIGYGTKMGLVPMHAWLPDAHAEGPTPISAVLSGLLLNVALYVILRFKMLLDASAAALKPGPVLITMGLITVLFATLMLYRRWETKRLFAYSSIEHMGIIAVAFGIGGPLANFAGLLHVAMHSLTKSAIFFAVGQAAQAKQSGAIANIRGLTVSHPALGWGLAIGVLAIAGLPPLGLFMSEFLLLSAAIARAPLIAAVLIIGLLIAFGCLILRLQGFLFGRPSANMAEVEGSAAPMFFHLAVVAIAGVYLPGPLVSLFHNIAELLG